LDCQVGVPAVAYLLTHPSHVCTAVHVETMPTNASLDKRPAALLEGCGSGPACNRFYRKIPPCAAVDLCAAVSHESMQLCALCRCGLADSCSGSGCIWWSSLSAVPDRIVDVEVAALDMDWLIRRPRLPAHLLLAGTTTNRHYALGGRSGHRSNFFATNSLGLCRSRSRPQLMNGTIIRTTTDPAL
jgi:hypothetical protein